MKTINKYFYLALFPILFIIGSCNGPINQIDEKSTGDAELKKGTTNKLVELTESEIAGILFMREEEKLAHDVYVKLYDLYEHKIFLNISESEQQHTDAILNLINFYGLEDSALPGIGEFNDLVLKQLFIDLMDMGEDGLVSALEVGVIIEEKDMTDIAALMEQTEVKNILQVYGNLLSGSENHLESFNMELDK